MHFSPQSKCTARACTTGAFTTGARVNSLPGCRRVLPFFLRDPFSPYQSGTGRSLKRYKSATAQLPQLVFAERSQLYATNSPDFLLQLHIKNMFSFSSRTKIIYNKIWRSFISIIILHETWILTIEKCQNEMHVNVKLVQQGENSDLQTWKHGELARKKSINYNHSFSHTD